MPEGTSSQARSQAALTPIESAQIAGALPGSRKTYVAGPDGVRVAMREIALSSGEQALTVYDTSGPYTDPAIAPDIEKGLASLRANWIEQRGDTETYQGAPIPAADGPLPAFPGEGHNIRRAKRGVAVTQLAYARAGIVTPEMEYVAIRENEGRKQASIMRSGT